jgi:diamine N-acetyltransferase
MIEGTRVRLRRMAREDAADVVRMRSDPDVQAQLFSARPPTVDEHLGWFTEVEARGDRHEFMIVQCASGRSVGMIGLSHIDLLHRRAEYGVAIGEPQGRLQGFATEASRLLLDYAFGVLRLHRVYLHVLVGNEPALRLYRRLGFEREGVLRDHVWKGGGFHDAALMAILAGERVPRSAGTELAG